MCTLQVVDDGAINELAGVTYFLDRKVDDDPARVIAILTRLVEDTFGKAPQLRDETQAAILMNAAGVVINAASRLGNEDALQSAEQWMTLVVGCGHLSGTRFESPSLYNMANCRNELVDLRAGRAGQTAPPSDRQLAFVEARFANRVRLQSVRTNLSSSAVLAETGRDRGLRLCNLANTLDHSGRWVEAYDCYLRALEADPENGNASGNAALLISRAIGAGWDYEGHMCALFDKHLQHAKDYRHVTVAVAGEHAAARYDDLDLLGTDVPLPETRSEAGDYRSWTARNRLALVATLEGLGSSCNESRWDTISLKSVLAANDDPSPPAVFAMLNVLKADFLVARRLAYEAEEIINETGGWEQPDSDPGVYADTLNYAVYGEVSSKLVLAHRAAMDILDKTAVVVNEHLRVGDDPKRVSFRKFWFEDSKCAALRSVLLAEKDLTTAVLSMAELAIDMEPGAIYGHAQDVRNAGTHRFVALHLGLVDFEGSQTMKTITLDAMRETCIQSLTVARAAYIYLVEMLRAFEASRCSGGATIPLFLPDAF